MWICTLSEKKKGTKVVTGAILYPLGTNMYLQGTKMDHLKYKGVPFEKVMP